MREQVNRARKTQRDRFKNDITNASMDTRQLKAFCDLSDSCLLLMKQARDELGLSARAYDKVRRVARTIADIEGVDRIAEHHLAEGIQYRLLDRRLGLLLRRFEGVAEGDLAEDVEAVDFFPFDQDEDRALRV